MPRISARFKFFFNLEPSYLAQINSSSYSLKANLIQGEESILWFPLERRIFENENNRGPELYLNADGKFNINGLFSCKLREGVAPWIQLKKKKFSLNILSTHVLFKDESSKLIEIDLKEFSVENRLATEWRLH
ncbi:hypothetical protein OAZ97_00315 [Prochlorococcus sp. AH-736-E15]|nr:hypothetical protein [Prochlorococcus sp. AH-736-E15]